MRKAAALLTLIAAASMHVIVGAQVVGRNKNVVSGIENQYIGDMHRQRQNESSVCVFSVNPDHQIVAYNDYRTVDEPLDLQVGTPSPAQNFVARLFNWFLRRPSPAPAKRWRASAQAWIGLSFTDNATDWYTGLHPGSPWDLSTPPLAFELQSLQFQAASDPVFAATPDKCLMVGIAFDNVRGESAGFVSRFTDRNNTETGANIHFDFTRVLVTQPSNFFVDKPNINISSDGKAYAAFVIFDESDPKKLSSKVVLYSSSDYGETWTTTPVVLSDPLTRNQSPWILIDPNDSNIVYVGWRVFSRQTNGISNAIVGKKSTNGGISFQPSFAPFPVALGLRAYDQPMTEYDWTSTKKRVLPIPRSAAYPTAVIDSHGAIHVALQEYVQSNGSPLPGNQPVSKGMARIVTTSSYNGGVTWTSRRAVDFGTGTGPQFMPVLSVAGAPGPTCAGRPGPRSIVTLAFYDSRASMPNGKAFTGGGDKQYDVRSLQADACNRDAGGNLVFAPSRQVSQYSRSAQPDSAGNHPIVTTAGYGKAAVNRSFRIFNSARSAFTGDYLGLAPRNQYVRTLNGWKATTASDVDPAVLPAPVFLAAWPDTRDVLLPTRDCVNPIPSLNDSEFFDKLPWECYAPPHSGGATTTCENPGSRDQNIYMAPLSAGLHATAPVTFKDPNVPRDYPLVVENWTTNQVHVRLQIASLNAQFNTPAPDVFAPEREADVTIGSFSSVTGSVIVLPLEQSPVLVTVQELDKPGGAPLPNGLRTSVTINTSGVPVADPDNTETRIPFIATPVETKPYGTIPEGGVEIKQTQDPLVSGGSSGFEQNPFGKNPFGKNETVFDATDVSFTVTNVGDTSAAFIALADVQKQVTDSGGYVFQVLINRTSLTPGFDPDMACKVIEVPVDNQISSIQTPFGKNPFGKNPFGKNPFGKNPFGKNESLADEQVSNSTFYIAPSDEESQQASNVAPARRPESLAGLMLASFGGGGLTAAQDPLPGSEAFRAERPPDEVIYTIRVFQLQPFCGAAPDTDECISSAEAFTADDVTLAVEAQRPNLIERNDQSIFDPGGPASACSSTSETQAPAYLAFADQPVNTQAGQTLTPVTVEIRDVCNRVVLDFDGPVTIALHDSPTPGAVLSGTLTVNADDGTATFDDLSINLAGEGYTLIATSGDLVAGTSDPFNITTDAEVAFIDCSVGTPSGGDFIDRGFYVPSYDGGNLSRVDLWFSSDTAGTYTFSLTARSDTYNGTQIGVAQATVTLVADRTANRLATFEFDGPPSVPEGTLVTFAIQRVSGPTDLVYYSVSSPAGCPIVQTNDTEPPLSTFRRNGVTVRIFNDAPPSAGTCVAAPAGMVSWWPGNGSAQDIWGENHGTPSEGGVSFSAGKVGEAFTLDGNGGFIEIAANESLQPEELTVDFWFRSDVALDGESLQVVPLVVMLDGNDDSDVASKGYDFIYQAGAIRFGLPRSPGTRTIAQYAVSIPAGEWHHVAGTFDGQFQRLYVDGVLRATVDWQDSDFGPLTYTPGTDVLLGRTRSSAFVEEGSLLYFLDGQIDEVELFSRALTATEIQSIFDANSFGKCKPGVSAYTFTGTVTAVDPALSDMFSTSMVLSGSFTLDTENPGTLSGTEENGFRDYLHGLTDFVMVVGDYKATPPFGTDIFDGFQVVNNYPESSAALDRFVVTGRLTGATFNDFGPLGFVALEDTTLKAFVDTQLKHVGDLTGWTNRTGHTGQWYLAFSADGGSPRISGVITSITRATPP